MNEFDFSQLSNLKTPEKWIENAVKIPQKNQKASASRFRPYWFGAAAACIVAAAAAVTLYFQTGSTADPLRTKPGVSVMSSAEATAGADSGSEAASGAGASPSAAAVTAAQPSSSAASSGVTATVPASSAAAQSSSSAAPSGATATVPASSAAAQPSSSVAPTAVTTTAPPPATAAQPSSSATVPATKPSTQPATNPQVLPVTEPSEADTTLSEETESDYFSGVLTFEVKSGSVYYSADSLTVDIAGEGADYKGLNVPLRAAGGEKTGVLPTYDIGILLPVPCRYTVTISDGSGHAQSNSILLRQSEKLTVRFSDRKTEWL